MRNSYLQRITRSAALTFVGLNLALCVGTQRGVAQGLLTVTPGRVTTTAAGTGATGYTGDGATATAATFAQPSAVAYDAAGDIFIADAQNHVIRELVQATGNIVTVAGTGIAGFYGDGGAATAAQLDTPVGVAVGTDGSLYIADSHNNRIRKVTNNTMTTLAGGGTASGNGPLVATSVALSLPSAVAVAADGSVYIADTNNHVVRKVSGSTITTVAGNGEQMFAGDGGSAVSASLDSPTGVAVDSAGNLYIADRLNQRIRMVNAAGQISTLAGSGTPTFSGSFSGDGASAAAASLARPTGVAVDPAGNVYVTDTNNNRLREVSQGGIVTVVGDGQQDAGSSLSMPRGAATDANGDISLSDTLNQRLLSTTVPVLTFTPQGIGEPSPAQPITLTNSGTASLALDLPVLTDNFTLASGGTCSSTTITLAPGASCIVNVTYTRTANGATDGSIRFGGVNVPQQQVRLTTTPPDNNTPRTGSVITFTADQPTAILGQPVTYSILVASQNGVGIPSGTLTLAVNGVAVGSVSLVNGAAQIVRSFSAAGPEMITTTYSGDTYYTASSTSFTQSIQAFTLAPQNKDSQTVLSGGTASYVWIASPVSGPFTFPITFSATGAPEGSVITFTPSTITPGATAANVTMTVKLPAVRVALHRIRSVSGSVTMFALLLLPFCGRLRRGGLTSHPRWLFSIVVTLVMFGSLVGCGTGLDNSRPPAETYDVVVTATGTGTNGATLLQTSSVQLTVE